MSTATFLKSDTTTQGTWYNGTTPIYGSDGCGIIGQGSNVSNSSITPSQGYFNYPAYATVSVAGETCYCWIDGTSAASDLEYGPPGTSNGTDSKRVAAAWFSTTAFTVDIQDGNTHQIALYFLDYSNQGREQTIQITDDNNANAVLDTRTLSSFSNGVWLVWSVSGKVKITFTPVTGPNAVLSGIFFDTPAAAIFAPILCRPRFEPAHYE